MYDAAGAGAGAVVVVGGAVHAKHSQSRRQARPGRDHDGDADVVGRGIYHLDCHNG